MCSKISVSRCHIMTVGFDSTREPSYSQPTAKRLLQYHYCQRMPPTPALIPSSNPSATLVAFMLLIVVIVSWDSMTVTVHGDGMNQSCSHGTALLVAMIDDTTLFKLHQDQKGSQTQGIHLRLYVETIWKCSSIQFAMVTSIYHTGPLARKKTPTSFHPSSRKPHVKVKEKEKSR